MQIQLWGVRGSTPRPGSGFVRYGGNTSCVAIAHDGEDPSLVLDAGTGLTVLSESLEGRPFRGSILLSHLHWDHTHGLPFFPAGDRDDARVDVYVPETGNPIELLERVLSPPHFPITPAALHGEWSFRHLSQGRHQFEGLEVTALRVPHEDATTYGYRISDGHNTLAYVSDHSPTSLGEGPDGHGPCHDAVLDLTRNADLVLHDAQYTGEEWQRKRSWGHSTVNFAVRLRREAKATRLGLFHHDPFRDDAALDVVQDSLNDPNVFVAVEGSVIQL